MLTPVVRSIGSTGVEAGSNAAARPAAAARAATSVGPPPQPDPGVAAAQAVDPIQLQEAVRRAGDVVRSLASNLRFTLDEATGRTVITIVDSQTEEVIRQIPSEEVLAIARNLDRIEGLLLKQKA